MAVSDRIKEDWNKTLERLNDAVWFQQLKAKWEEIDPQQRLYVKSGAIVSVVLAVLIGILSSIWSVRSLRNELNEKVELASFIESQTETVRNLRSSHSGFTGGNEPWNTYFESRAGAARIEIPSLTISAPKPGTTKGPITETLYTISAKKISIRQAVSYAVQLEIGSRPVKVRNAKIDTHADPEGYLDAEWAVSAFDVAAEPAPAANEGKSK